MAEATLAPRQDRLGLGIVMMLGAWFLFSLTDTTVKWLVVAGVSAMQLAFFRYAVALGLSLARGARGPLLPPLSRRHLALLLLRAFCLISATALNFIALRYLSLTVTSAIMFSSPIIVCALSGPLLGEQVGPRRWAAIVLGFIGVLIVIRPLGAEVHWSAILIVYNATALALYAIITRQLSGVISPQTMQLTMGAAGTLALLPLAVLTWHSPDTGAGWVLMVAVGALAWAGHELFARAMLYGDASTLSPYQYSFILYMTVAGFLVFGDLPDLWTLVGAAVIVVSGLIIWKRESRPINVAR